MALLLDSAGRVRQKAREITRNPAVFLSLQGFFSYWSGNKNNRDLQLIPIKDAEITGADGVISVDVPVVVYVIYVKKGPSAVDSYFKLFDDAVDDSTAGDSRIVVSLLEANEEYIAIFPEGLTMAAGIVATSHTTSAGSTDSVAGDSGSGFLIVGQADLN